MEKDKKYGTDELWFENGEKLGEGGGGAVNRCLYHGIDAAYKKIEIVYDKTKTEKVNIRVGKSIVYYYHYSTEIEFENDKERAIWEISQEYEIQKNVATKPKVLTMINSFYWYKFGDEGLILRPLSYFFVENQSGSLFMILVLPKCKSDLNKIKKEGKLDEENIRTIIQQLWRARRYLWYVRSIRHQDLKPSNILLDYDETKNRKIKNIQEKYSKY